MSDGLFDLEPYTVAQAEPEQTNGRTNTTLTGRLSEHAAIGILLERGHKVAIPVVDDDGVDLVVDYRYTVQVKSRSGRTRFNTYVFNFGRSTYSVEGVRRDATRSAKADFFVCHAQVIDAWWVIPRALLLGAGFRVPDKTGFSLSADPRTKTKYAELSRTCRDAWHLIGES